jgi:hypothetical protein
MATMTHSPHNAIERIGFLLQENYAIIALKFLSKKEEIMSKAKVIFYQCNQDSQEYGSDDEYMVSRIFFTLEIGEERFEGLCADIKQTAGSDYDTAPIEVSQPHGYEGAFNHHAFRDCAEKYYRSCVGSETTGIEIEEGVRIRMYNNVFKKEMVCEFEISGGSEDEKHKSVRKKREVKKSKDEIRELIEKVFDERIQIALTRMTNIQKDFSTRKDLLILEDVSQDDPRIKALDTEIPNLDIGIMLLKSLKG